ncbi:DUF5988 family protein [Micromonospora sp. FIMYZ51]|uniref:DUF5988 family protein n=1 Tax=Micromonospora sp. FIMYZ51 TaxID=3051832 RepID=UPI00311F9C53
MNGRCIESKDQSAIEVVLEGGPASITAEQRSCRTESDTVKIKIAHCGGYEHFERIDNSAGNDAGPVVFRWSMRTRVAE